MQRRAGSDLPPPLSPTTLAPPAWSRIAHHPKSQNPKHQRTGSDASSTSRSSDSEVDLNSSDAADPLAASCPAHLLHQRARTPSPPPPAALDAVATADPLPPPPAHAVPHPHAPQSAAEAHHHFHPAAVPLAALVEGIASVSLPHPATPTTATTTASDRRRPAPLASPTAPDTNMSQASAARSSSRSAPNLAAVAVSSEVMKLTPYTFPTERLQLVQQDPRKEPLVLVACGSYSPITYLHLRMFEMAMDSVSEAGRFEMLGGYFSPVHDGYGKIGLASAEHRVAMCRLAATASDWLMVDAWEPSQPAYVRTIAVLDHFHHELNVVRGGVTLPDGTRRPIRIMLLAGGDLIESFGTPNLWAEADLHRILGEYGCFIIERTGTDVWAFLLSHDILYEHRRNVFVVKQLIYNDISSTKVRLFVKRNMSIKYLVPDSVMHHIYAHRLYIGEREPPSAV
ncbi:Nicotinamide/nicotinic acid mononucleotide adenylyltransferase 1 [Blastocladiella emersonii ATCC 22665]|nr:Nicotinamide/nicotinic acid mononucleotide adenylyltransferase 1 [Blastocladiella emersonii ATCC 22665]